MMALPVMVNPVKNLSTANMMKEEEKALHNPKPIPNIYDTSSIGLRPNLSRDRQQKVQVQTPKNTK